MPATVTLSVHTGGSTHEYVYPERVTCLVGRSEECDIRIDDGQSRVSRRHCRLEIDPPELRIRDMGSRNGTYVNGERIGRLTERALVPGDEVRLGGVVLHVAVSQTEEPASDGAHHHPDTIVSAMLRAASAGDPAFDAFRGYELVRELGRGGQGVVYLARHTGSGELVALKLLLARVAVDPSARFGFLREFESIRALRHANIVEFLGGGVSGSEFYFTCEYCPGGSVDQLVARRGGPLSLDEAVPIALQALDGLRHAHQATIPAVRRVDGQVAQARGLVHRDIKPPNILLSGSRPVAKLADFGLAKAFDHAGLSGHTRTGAVGGTIPFMARTQLINYKFAGPEVDVWAVAACLYWMLTGATPRDFPADKDPVAVALREPAVRIRERVPSVPLRLAAVLDEALVDKPRISITTADELARALRDAL